MGVSVSKLRASAPPRPAQIEIQIVNLLMQERLKALQDAPGWLQGTGKPSAFYIYRFAGLFPPSSKAFIFLKAAKEETWPAEKRLVSR